MALSNKFATGRYANAICDRCGFRAKYVELREETIRGHRKAIRVCPTCWDPEHPQNFLDRFVRTDAMALRYARPQTDLWASRQLKPPGNWINGRPPDQVAAEGEKP